MIPLAALALVLASAAPSSPFASTADSVADARRWAAPDTALLTFEHGALVAADWIQQRGATQRSLAVLMRSAVRDARVEIRADGTADRSTTRVGNVDGALGAPIERTFAGGAVAWSDQIPSSIEWVVRRARALGGDAVRLEGASLYRDSHVPIDVTRTDSTDWVVRVNGKRYEVLTDRAGALLAATLPDYGVEIERRIGFRRAAYADWLPNDPAPGAPYAAREVAIPAPEGHVLAGTLTTPSDAAPIAAAVLITGLSPSDRNGGVPPWMPLRDFADALSRHGIAVLRVDDRGVGRSTGDHGPSTTFDEATDVETEARWLRAQPGFAGRPVLLVGYSEGGLIAPMVAADDPAIAGIVTLAGPGVSGPEVAHYQIEAAVVRDTTIAPAARAAEIARQLADTLTVRERSYLGIDPLAYARRVRCPALIVQGGADLHVPLRSAERLAAAMRSSGNGDVTVRVFQGLSHSLLPDPLGLNSGWAALPGFMTAPELLDAITDWATERYAASAASAPHRRRSPRRAIRRRLGDAARP